MPEARAYDSKIKIIFPADNYMINTMEWLHQTDPIEFGGDVEDELVVAQRPQNLFIFQQQK